MSDDQKENLPAPIADDGFTPVATSEDRAIVGTLLKFSKENGWTEMGLAVPAGMKLLALAVDVVLQRWQDQRVIETISEKPLPSVADLNSEIPKQDWEPDLTGNPRPPWVRTYLIYLLNESTCEKYTFANSTIGARLAHETLQDRVAWMRRLRGTNVVPEVGLSTKPMKTRFGTQPRPDFKIINWKLLGEGSSPTAPQIAGPMTSGIADVEPMTTEEEFNDKLPF